MPKTKEPSIYRMDWKALGYDPVWKDGRIVWEKDNNEKK
jgi:hypothetical protein